MTRNFSNVLKIYGKKENAGRCRHRSIDFFFIVRVPRFPLRCERVDQYTRKSGLCADFDCLRKITFQQNKAWDFVWTEFYLFSTYHPEFETKFECLTERVDNNKRDYEIFNWTKINIHLSVSCFTCFVCNFVWGTKTFPMLHALLCCLAQPNPLFWLSFWKFGQSD